MNARSNASELQAIVNDYSFLEDENLALKDEIRSGKSAINDLDRANRDLTERLERITGERDKLQAFSINLVTRLHVISENVENIVKEAGRSAVAEAGRLREGREVQDRIGVHPVRRAAAEAAQHRHSPHSRGVPISVAAESELIHQATEPFRTATERDEILMSQWGPKVTHPAGGTRTMPPSNEFR
jgi:hypothetical protein